MFIDNIKKIRYRMHTAARSTNRNGDEIALIAVTKYAPLDQVREALASDLITDVGESRVQDAEKKKIALGTMAQRARWHMIGHLQTNKAKKAVFIFDAIDSIDSHKIALAIDAALADSGRRLPVMIQVKLSDKETQSGVLPGDLPLLISQVKSLTRLNLTGLMGIAPAAPAQAAREAFRRLRILRDEHLPNGFLSMGMSPDFEVAIEEGADIVRIGSDLFKHSSKTEMEAPA